MKAESIHVRQDVQYIRTMNKVEGENVNGLKPLNPFLSVPTEEHYYADTLGITRFLEPELDKLKLIYSYCIINYVLMSVLQSA